MRFIPQIFGIGVGLYSGILTGALLITALMLGSFVLTASLLPITLFGIAPLISLFIDTLLLTACWEGIASLSTGVGYVLGSAAAFVADTAITLFTLPFQIGFTLLFASLGAVAHMTAFALSVSGTFLSSLAHLIEPKKNIPLPSYRELHGVDTPPGSPRRQRQKQIESDYHLAQRLQQEDNNALFHHPYTASYQKAHTSQSTKHQPPSYSTIYPSCEHMGYSPHP